MPNIITHYLCGAKTWELLSDHQLKNIIAQNRQAFNLGTQGPDILFYYRVWPWTKDDGINKIGEMMHRHQVNAFFSHALSYIIKQYPGEKNMLTAYLCGYACHYALDFLTHPYVFYKTGFVRPGEPPTSKFTAYHRVFETNLDVCMLKLVLGKRPAEIEIGRLLQVSPQDALKIGGLYQTALGACGMSITPRQTSRAIQDMILVQRVFRDKFGIKKALLSRIEKILGQYPLISGMIYPLSVSHEETYLNLDHRPWRLPWDPASAITASFPEMFSQAAAEAKELALAILSFLTGQIEMEHVLARLGNRSFSTGLDCSGNPNFIVYDCIFERNPS